MITNLEELYLLLDDLIEDGVDLTTEVAMVYFDSDRNRRVGSIKDIVYNGETGTVDIVENLE